MNTKLKLFSGLHMILLFSVLVPIVFWIILLVGSLFLGYSADEYIIDITINTSLIGMDNMLASNLFIGLLLIILLLTTLEYSPVTTSSN